MSDRKILPPITLLEKLQNTTREMPYGILLLMTTPKVIKEIISKTKKTEEQLSIKLVHKTESKLLPVLLNIFTETGSTYGVLSIFLVIGILNGITPLLYMFPIYFTQLLLVEIIKLIANRQRPKTLYNKPRLFNLKTTSGSFPSGHSSNIFTLAILLTTYYNPNLLVVIAIFLIATLVAISRLYLGRHYIIDIAGGIIIGVAITMILVANQLPFLITNLYQNVFY